MTRDLTYGKPMKLIFQFGLPILFGFLFQQLYNAADTAIVGKFLGGDALAAVGSTGSVNFLVIGFCMGICNGFSIPIAQQFGARNYTELKKYVTGSVWLSLFFAVVITSFTVIFCADILTIMKTPDEIFDRANTYILTIFAGIPTFFLYNMCAAILRSLGNSKTPVTWLIVSSLVNIVLDVVFIVYFRLDVFGAALATVTAQTVSGIGCLVRLIKDFSGLLSMEKSDWRFSLRHSGELCANGLPMGLQYSITAIGSIVIQTAVNSLGTAYVTAVTAASKLSMFMCCPFDAMGSTMATYAGQNVGARKWNRLNKGLGSCVVIGAGYAVIALAAVLIFGGSMSMIFLDENSSELVPLVKQYLVVQAAFYFPLALVNIIRFMIQGMGFSPLAAVAGVLEMIGRSIIAFMVADFGFDMVCFASPAAWILADIFLIIAYFRCRKRLITRSADSEEAEGTLAVQGR